MKGAVIKAVAEFAQVITGGTPSTTKPEYWDGDIPWLNSGSLNDGVITTPSKHITQLGLSNSSAKLMPKDTVLVALTGATTGQVGYLAIEASANQSVTGILPSKEHHPKYLYFFLKSQRKKMLGDAFGGAQPHINQKYVKDFKIPLPSLDDQIRIAHLLGKVEGLIAQRKQHLQQLDDLLKSVFLEMFGDPVQIKKRWPINPLAIYMSEQPNNGLYKPQSSYGSGTKIIRIDSFYDGIVQNIDGLKRVEITDSELLKFEIRPFDVLVNRVNSIEYLGKIGVVPAISEPMVYESNMMRFRLNQELMLPVFLMYFWRTPYLKSQINSKAKKAVNQASVNQQDVISLLVPQPPIDLQIQFAAIVEKVDVLKSQYKQSLDDLEALYGALSQQAFKGELDLTRVPLPSIQVQEENAVATEPLQPPEEQVQTIHLPDTDNILDALESTEWRQLLISHWLEAYRSQLGHLPFSVQHFIAVAQTRLAELHPDNEFELGASDYEHIKEWVFNSLANGVLTQEIDNEKNQIVLKPRAAEWGSW